MFDWGKVIHSCARGGVGNLCLKYTLQPLPFHGFKVRMKEGHESYSL